MGEATGDEHVLVGERDRRSAVQLADEILEGHSGGAALPGRTEPPEDARGSADALEGTEEEAVQILVLVREGDEREMLHVMVELLLGQRETHPCTNWPSSSSSAGFRDTESRDSTAMRVNCCR